MNLTKMRHARDRRRPGGILVVPEGTTAEFCEQFSGALESSNDLRRDDPQWDVQVVTNGLGVRLREYARLVTFHSEPKQ